MALRPAPVRTDRAAVPSVSVIIPVLNDATGLARCLASVRANDAAGARLEILVADNGSTDGSSAVAERAGATVVRLPGIKVSAARNQMAASATGEILAFIDADHELSTDWFRSAIDALRRPGTAAVGAPYRTPSDPTWVQRIYDSLRSRSTEPCEVRWLGGGNLAIWRRTFSEVGGFDTSLTACEDVDLCQRLRRAGHRLIADERLRSVHYGDPGTLRQLFASELWRGRDNLVVSLRGPLTLRDVPSVVIPLLELAALVALPVAGAAALFGRPGLLAATVLCATAAPAARSIAMAQRTGDLSPRGWGRAFAVASTYDLARALALVVRKPHRRA